MIYKVHFEVLLYVQGVPKNGDSILVMRDVKMPFVPFPGMGIILCCDDCGEMIIEGTDIIWSIPGGTLTIDLSDQYGSIEEMRSAADHFIQCGWQRAHRLWVDGEGNVVGEE